MRLAQERAEVVRLAQRMVAERLVVGTSGNVSMRAGGPGGAGDLVAVTPSGLDYADLTPELVCVTDLSGRVVEGELQPTSEIALHLTVYARTAHRVVVHTHSTCATAVSTLVDELPTVHYLTAVFGGPVPVTPYRTFGTVALAEEVGRALADRHGCLLGNHGTVTAGATPVQAYDRALYLEWMCDVWLRARAVGEPRLLSLDEIDRVAAKIATYGQTAPSRQADTAGPADGSEAVDAAAEDAS